VLSAIDGRATLGEVAQKVGKSFDAEFEKLIALLDKDGFVREVSTAPASSSASQSRPGLAAAKPAAAKAPAMKPAGSAGGADDLDFTSIMPVLKPGRPAAPAPAPAKPAQPDAGAQQRAKEQESALYKARQEAEARAQAERERLRQETEAKARAEAEAKIRAETEKKLREETDAKNKVLGDAKARAAREAAARLAAEVKARTEADARARIEAEAQARIEAERKAREEAERKARALAEKAQREAEELRQRLEEERQAREAEERKRKELEEAQREAEKAVREAEELRQQLEVERQAREAEERKRKELEQARRAAEAEQARAQQARELEQARERSRARPREQDQSRETAVPPLPTLAPESRQTPAASTQFGAGSLDALMADLDSFSQREEDERRVRDAAEQKDRDDKKRRVQEDAERRAREQAAEQERERSRAAEEARRREEEESRAQEEAERRVREAEEQRRAEAEERKRRAQESLAARPKAAPPEDDIKVTDDDLGMDDVRRDESAVAREARKAQRAKEREARRRAQEARERAEAAAREAPVKYPKARRPVKWGRPVAIGFFVALVATVGALHVMPLPMADYEAAASEALGRPVRIGSAHLSLFTGVRLDLSNVTVGDRVRIATVHAYPRIGSLFDEKKAFRRVELIGAVVPQQAIGGVIAARLRGRSFEVERIVATNLKLDGAVPLPAFEADAVLGPDGAVRSITLRGPDSLDARLTPSANGEVEFDVTAASLAVPFVPELSLGSFAMKGSANGNGMKIASWGGAALDGVLGGSANVRWASAWQVDGTLTVRGINAAWFAPALLSEGKAEGSARFSMSGADPAKLHDGARMEGSFTVGKGALGTFDLSRLLQTSGRQHGGRTPFTEMSGQATYDRGAVALRNVNISAGALTAGASADIAPGGALAGRIVADVRTTLQPLRGMLVLGGTVKEPQVRN
jgi:hypothetical protein